MGCSFDKQKGITITDAFQIILHESAGPKSNITNIRCVGKSERLKEIWVDKGSECYNKSMKSWLRNNGVEMHSTHNERFIRS